MPYHDRWQGRGRGRVTIWRQLAIIAALALAGLPLMARFVPGSHGALQAVGLLAPLQAMGLVAEAAAGPAGGPRGGGPVQVLAFPPGQDALRDRVVAIGTARGAQSVALAAGISGRILSVDVAPGDRVTAGQVVMRLDPGAAELLVERAELMLADAQATLDRLSRLQGSGAVTALQRQDAELALRTADLALRQARRDLADHQVTSPIAGVVGLIDARPGDLVTASTELTRVERRDSLEIEFRVPERVAALVAPGAAVQASPVSQPDRRIEGTVTAVDNRVDDTSRTLRLQARIDNADDSLRPGMAFRMELGFVGETRPSVNPLAIQWGGEGAFLWLVREAKATRLPIRILQRESDRVLVEGDLQPGDLVVTEGVQALRPGAEVAVQSAAADPES